LRRTLRRPLKERWKKNRKGSQKTVKVGSFLCRSKGCGGGVKREEQSSDGKKREREGEPDSKELAATNEEKERGQ